MTQASFLKKVTGFFRSANAADRLCLEVRPDGIAWALNPGDAGQAVGFLECTPAKRRESLQALVSGQGWNGATTTLVLPMDQYHVFQMERPEGLEDSELADALRWKLKDLLDYSPADAVSDVFPFPEDAARGRGDLVNVVAARKSLILELVGLVQDADLALDRIDIAELALRNLTARLSTTSRSAALVHLRDSHGQLVICRGRTLYLSRRLDVAAADLRDASKQEHAVQTLALEMQRSLDYFESQMGQVPPSTIHLVARDSVLPLASMLSAYVAAGIETPGWADLGLEAAPDSRCVPAWSAGLPLPEEGEA